MPVMPAEGINPTPVQPETTGSNRWKTWHSDDDIPQRKVLIQHMCVGAEREAARATAHNPANPKSRFHTFRALQHTASTG